MPADAVMDGERMMILREEVHFGRAMRCYAPRPANVWEHLSRVINQNPEAVAVVEGDAALAEQAIREAGYTPVRQG